MVLSPVFQEIRIIVKFFHRVNDDITIYAEMKPVITQQNC